MQCTESAQEVVSVGSGPLHLGALRIQQIACAEKLALLLTHDGAVYTLPYDTMTPQLVPGKLYYIAQTTDRSETSIIGSRLGEQTHKAM